MFLINLLKNNIQVNQTLILSIILYVGVTFFNLDISYLEIFITFFTVILVDLFFIKYNTGKWVFPYSGVNAGFGISFFLRSEDLILYVFAGFLAIVGKNVFRINKKHFMNPSNMAVFLTLFLFPHYAWTNPLQWGQSVPLFNYLFIVLLIFVFGLFILSKLTNLLKSNYYDLILSFILTHLILFFTITQESGFNSFLLFFNASFFIFLFFMFTDPRTNLSRSSFRIIYGISVAIMFYILQFYINENYSLLGSLFFMTLLLPIFRIFEKKNNNKSIYFLLSFLIIIIVLLSIHLLYYKEVDLLFDNRCNQFICN